MTRIPTPDDIAILLDAFERRGGVLEFAFYKLDSVVDSLEAHREAARLFLDEHATACWGHRDSITKGIPYARLMEQSRYRWNEAKLQGERISRESFMGTDGLNAKDSSDPFVDGYKQAFFLPPYGLGGSMNGNLLLFELINRHFLDDHDGNGDSIWSWSTDCSSYFDDGHEWWGAYLWTIAVPHREMIVLIAASTTD